MEWDLWMEVVLFPGRNFNISAI